MSISDLALSLVAGDMFHDSDMMRFMGITKMDMTRTKVLLNYNITYFTNLSNVSKLLMTSLM